MFVALHRFWVRQTRIEASVGRRSSLDVLAKARLPAVLPTHVPQGEQHPVLGCVSRLGRLRVQDSTFSRNGTRRSTPLFDKTRKRCDPGYAAMGHNYMIERGYGGNHAIPCHVRVCTACSRSNRAGGQRMIERMSVEHDKYLNLTRGDQNATRRTFLKGMLTAAAGVGTAAAMARFGISPWMSARAVSANSVVVIGGGIAGMRAAWGLTKKGKQVTVFEFDDRIGGRIETRFWPNGKHSEDGMEEYNGSDTFLWDFIKSLHIPTDQLAAKDAYFFPRKYSDHASGAGGFTQMVAELLTPDEQAFYYAVATH